jgi:hypothetical protein
MIIVYEDGAGFALLVDAEHLDTKFIGVDGGSTIATRAIGRDRRAIATATDAAAPAPAV